ncbi:hypothetical protein GCM10022215_04580 [Nocardioides fonticola]|uniref:Integral membrane protein n=1 Tax=Nocardioides fonticola TaxID=450363 RepID=A0ABP7XB92_9ACTN
MTDRDPRLEPRGGRGSSARGADPLTGRAVPLAVYRLLLSTVAGLLFLLAVIIDAQSLGTVAAAMVLASALASRYSRDRSPDGFGRAFLPGLQGAGAAAFIAAVAGAGFGWHVAAWLAGAAAVLFVVQVLLVLPWGKPSLEERMEQIRRDLAEEDPS